MIMVAQTNADWSASSRNNCRHCIQINEDVCHSFKQQLFIYNSLNTKKHKSAQKLSSVLAIVMNCPTNLTVDF